MLTLNDLCNLYHVDLGTFGFGKNKYIKIVVAPKKGPVFVSRGKSIDETVEKINEQLKASEASLSTSTST